MPEPGFSRLHDQRSIRWGKGRRAAGARPRTELELLRQESAVETVETPGRGAVITSPQARGLFRGAAPGLGVRNKRPWAPTRRDTPHPSTPGHFQALPRFHSHRSSGRSPLGAHTSSSGGPKNAPWGLHMKGADLTTRFRAQASGGNVSRSWGLCQ